MKAFFQKYKHAWVLLYGFIYLPWFFWLESRANQPYHVIHVWLDDKIPFVEYFIVPYLLWFVYIAAVFLYLFFKGTKKEFYRYCFFLFTGMTPVLSEPASFCVWYKSITNPDISVSLPHTALQVQEMTSRNRILRQFPQSYLVEYPH